MKKSSKTKAKVLIQLTINDTMMVRIVLPAGESGQHDIRPGLTCGAPEHDQIIPCSLYQVRNILKSHLALAQVRNTLKSHIALSQVRKT